MKFTTHGLRATLVAKNLRLFIYVTYVISKMMAFIRYIALLNSADCNHNFQINKIFSNNYSYFLFAILFESPLICMINF